MKRKKILITGGAGFLGTHLVEYLLRKGNHEIVIFDKLEHHKREKYGEKVIYFKGNIIDKQDVSKVFKMYSPFYTV